jgi:hypothetical protein
MFPLRAGQAQSPLADAVIRSLAAICLGFVGYWLPLLCANYIERPFAGADFDDRLGFLFVYSLPIILFYAARASTSQVQACRKMSSLSWSSRVALVIGGSALCWSPVISIAIGTALRK